jgi:(S)-2-hydroxyglutarate dehydrogenase
MEDSFDLVIIGAGIVGLAAAMEAVRRYPRLRIAILDKEAQIAMHQSGHNSGVIHSGIYYQPGSLKARNCVAGASALIAFCRQHGIDYQLCGKVIVATDHSELPGLQKLFERGKANGVGGLDLIGPERLRELEPHCTGVAALHVPGAGITDYSQIARKYAELISAGGGKLITGCAVVGIRRNASGQVLETTRGAITAKWTINCAGLHSDRIRKLAGDAEGPKIIPFRGEYYHVAPHRTSLIRNLIYPVPDPQFPFLGVHFTRKLDGGVEAGPNAVLALKREGYRKRDFDRRDIFEALAFPGFWKMATRYWTSGIAEMLRSVSRAAFAHSLQKLVPEIRTCDLYPGGSGVRAQAVDRNGRLLDDFSIVTSGDMIHVCNVPSPAATASLIIGRQIVDIAHENLGLASVSLVSVPAPFERLS